MFATKNSVTQLSDLPPMRVFLRDPKTSLSRPVKSRNLSLKKVEAMRQKLIDMLRVGIIKQVNDAVFGSPAFVVEKVNGKFRFVTDLTELNALCEETPFILPDIELQLKCTPHDAKYFGLFDAYSGFDLLRVDRRDMKYFIIKTIFGCFMMLGSPQGFLDTPGMY